MDTRIPALLFVVGIAVYGVFKVTHPDPAPAETGQSSKAVSDLLNSHHLAQTMLEANVMTVYVDAGKSHPATIVEGAIHDMVFSYDAHVGDVCAPWHGARVTACGTSLGYRVDVRSAKDAGVWVTAQTTADRDTTNAHDVANVIEANVVAAVGRMLVKDKEESERAASWAPDAAAK